MSLLLSIVFFIVGVVRFIRGAYFIEAAACFIVSGLFCISWQIYYIYMKETEKEKEKLKTALKFLEGMHKDE